MNERVLRLENEQLRNQLADLRRFCDSNGKIADEALDEVDRLKTELEKAHAREAALVAILDPALKQAREACGENLEHYGYENEGRLAKSVREAMAALADPSPAAARYLEAMAIVRELAKADPYDPNDSIIPLMDRARALVAVMGSK